MRERSKTKCCYKCGGKIDTQAGEFIVKDMGNDVSALTGKMVTFFNSFEFENSNNFTVTR